MQKIVTRSKISGSVRAPSSKSYAQRAIAAALLARGESMLLNMDLCLDTAAALDAAYRLGADVERLPNGACRIRGGLNPRASVIDIGESGLAARMFTPIASLCAVPVTVAGRGTISARPMDMIAGPLRELGVAVESRTGRLPLTICGPLRGGKTVVDGSVSSQFITGLLIALPLAESDTVFSVTHPVSTPYIDMTVEVLEDFGIEVRHDGYTEFFVGGRQRYVPREYTIEGDWSGAACLLVAGAVAGEVTVRNLKPSSRQADVAIVDALMRAGAGVVTTDDSVTVTGPGCLKGFDFDATNCPDLFPALATLAANCEGESVIAGAHRLKYKESGRAETLRAEYSKMGIAIDILQDNDMRIRGGPICGAAVDSHGDHRIAMSLAVAALNATDDVIIRGAESVDKSYPGFWDDLGLLTVWR